MQVKKFYKPLVAFATLLILFFIFKFIVPLIFPFLISGALALFLYPRFQKHTKRLHISPAILGIIFIVLFFLLSTTALFFLGKALLQEMRSLMGNLPYYEDSILCCLSSACHSLGNLTGLQAAFIESSIMTGFESFLGNMQHNFSSEIFSHSFSYVKVFITLITVCFLTFVSFVLWLKDFETIKKMVKSLSYYDFFLKTYQDGKNFIGTYLKAQLIILSVTCVVSVVGLFLLKNPYALLLGIFIGLLDALPFLGTGCIFIPCGIFHLLQADFYYSAIYLTLYLATALSREFLEPRLIGSKFGIPSILILIAIYAGIRMFGIFGVVLGPMYFLLSYEIVHYFTNLE